MNNIYGMIENPFSREDTIKGIITAYTDNYHLYTGLTESSTKDKISGRYSEEDLDKLYLMLFDNWRETIHRINEAAYLEEPHKSVIARLDNYLQTLKPKNYKDVKRILEGKVLASKDLQHHLEAFRWDNLGEASSWSFLESSVVRVGLEKRQKVSHRLYINCDSTKTHLIARKFIEKCNQEKTGYYFKYDPAGDRDDTIVIYSSTENLPYYIKMLNEIIEENDLSSSIHNPPLLTGRIGKWIGYGSEPQEKDGKSESFNIKREQHIEKCIREETSSWIKKHLLTRIRYGGAITTYGETFVDDIIRTTREHVLRFMNGTEQDIKNRGYSKKEVQSSFFDIVLLRTLNQNIEAIIEQYRTNKNGFQLEIPFGNGTVIISKRILEEVFKNQVKLISKSAPNFNKSLQERILETAKDFDIDKDNYAVDLSRKSSLLSTMEQEDNGIKLHQEEPIKAEENISNDRPKSKRKKYNYTPMTDEEIEASRRRLGFK